VDKLIADEAPWSFFMPWYGDFVRNAKYNPLDLWKKMFAHDYVLSLDEMPNLKSYEPVPATWRSSLYPENWKPGFKDSNDRFLHDFSYAGYHQGEIDIPTDSTKYGGCYPGHHIMLTMQVQQMLQPLFRKR
jgi:hypothetical protein